MDEFMKSVIEIGFPVVVSGFLLLRMESRIESLTQAIENLRHCQTCRLSPMLEALTDDEI